MGRIMILAIEEANEKRGWMLEMEEEPFGLDCNEQVGCPGQLYNPKSQGSFHGFLCPGPRCLTLISSLILRQLL